MKILLILAVVVSSFATTLGRAAQTAEARMYCLSVKFNQGYFSFYTLDLTGINNGINGELFPIYNDPRTHRSFLRLNDPNFGPIWGSMWLDVPMNLDENGNGFPDFFEVSQPFGGMSTGDLDMHGSGTVSASWWREAGSHTGTAQLTLWSSTFGSLGTFTHTFEIIEYAGPLDYAPGESTVAGSVDLTRTGHPDDRMQGAVAFVKSSSDPHNELELQAGAWTNAAEETLSFLSNVFLRFAEWPANYAGYFDFNDWDLSTLEPDYFEWVLSIDDPNDSNGNGIPDFSDDMQTALPRPPLLSVAHTATEVLLTISGDVGSLCEIQESSSLPAAAWSTVLSVALETDPQTISLPPPASGTRFWQALAR